MKLNASHMSNQSYANAKYKIDSILLASWLLFSHLTFIVYRLFLSFMIHFLRLHTFSQLIFLSYNIRNPSSH